MRDIVHGVLYLLVVRYKITDTIDIMKLDKPPKKDFANHLHKYFNQTAKTLTGGFVNPLIDVILPSFHQKQFEKWCHDVYNAILDLEDRKITLEQLRDNLEFVSLLKESMIIASKNHEHEKLLILKSGLLNSLKDSVPYDNKLIFTRLIDSLSVSHHIVLKTLNENIDSFKNLDKYQDIHGLFQEYSGNLIITKRQLIFLLDDLDKNRLIKVSRDIEDVEIVKEASRLVTGYGDNNLPFITVTDFGKDYLNYILDN